MPEAISRLLARLRGRELALGLVWALARALAVCLAAVVVSCAIDWSLDAAFGGGPDGARFLGKPESFGLMTAVVLVPLLALAWGRREGQAAGGYGWAAAAFFLGLLASSVVTLAAFLVEWRWGALTSLQRWALSEFTGTPYVVRVLLFDLQLVIWVGAAVFVALPLLRRIGDDELALLVEEKVPGMGHRLISAVQLNREGARTEGLSAELIAATTRQAEERAGQVELSGVSDGSRYRWAAQLVGPAVAAVALLYLAMPGTASALLSRLFLGEAEIPRRVRLSPEVAGVWPAGEPVELSFRAEGAAAGEEGVVFIAPEEGPATTVALVADEKEPGRYLAQVPASDVAFKYRAWLGDGRMKEPGSVAYSPRPVVQSIQAWVVLPKEISGDAALEEPQKSGDIVYSVAKSRARIRVAVQTPIAECVVTVRGENGAGAARGLTPSKDGLSAEGLVDLDGVKEGHYEVRVRCPHGFNNLEVPRRAITRAPLEPPVVRWLMEARYEVGFSGSREDYEFEGIPVGPAGTAVLEYRARARYGIDRAVVWYRVAPPDVLRNAVTELQKFTEDQEKLKEDTAKAAEEGLPDVAERQRELAGQLEAFRDAGKEALGTTAEALTRTAEAMRQAAQAIEKKDKKKAGAGQDEALAGLARGRRELNERFRFHPLKLGTAEGAAPSRLTREQFWTWTARARELLERQKKLMRGGDAGKQEGLRQEAWGLMRAEEVPPGTAQALAAALQEMGAAHKALLKNDNKAARAAQGRAVGHLEGAVAAAGFPGAEGGGKHLLKVEGIPGPKGLPKVGDRIQFYVEVYSRAAPKGPAGQSPIREKDVVDQATYAAWKNQKQKLLERTRSLEKDAMEKRPSATD